MYVSRLGEVVCRLQMRKYHKTWWTITRSQTSYINNTLTEKNLIVKKILC